MRRPHQIQDFRFRLHHVRRNAPRIGHGVMNAGLLNHMLPQIIDAHVHQFHRIERTAAQMRRRPGVRTLAVEFESDLIVRQRAHRKNRVVSHRMPGQRNIRAGEGAFPRHERFSRPALFARTAIVPDGSRDFCFRQIFLDGHRRRQCADPQQIMAAAVTIPASSERHRLGNAAFLRQSGQCVVFPQNRHHRSAAAIAGHKSRSQTADSLFHGKTRLREHIAEQVRRPGFLEPHFGVFPDGVAGPCEPFALFLNDRLNALLVHPRVPPLLRPLFGAPFQIFYLTGHKPGRHQRSHQVGSRAGQPDPRQSPEVRQNVN